MAAVMRDKLRRRTSLRVAEYDLHFLFDKSLYQAARQRNGGILNNKNRYFIYDYALCLLSAHNHKPHFIIELRLPGYYNRSPAHSKSRRLHERFSQSPDAEESIMRTSLYLFFQLDTVELKLTVAADLGVPPTALKSHPLDILPNT